jgi:LPPG:FO 2-phospho-L-lactate transferase
MADGWWLVMSIVVLAGGVGAARFLQGLVQVVPPEDVIAIVNTGDDVEMHGLHVSPDIDIVAYSLAGLVDSSKGWGIRRDTFACQDFLARFGQETWFRLGDRDLATCLHRTMMLEQGFSLADTTDHIRRALGVGIRLIPMSNDPVRTEIETPVGWLPFQEYFVKRGQRDAVLGIRFAGIETAEPAPGLLQAIDAAEVVVIAPSNPFVSIGTILATKGVRDTLRRRRATTVAVSPIIGGRAVKGPLEGMLRGMGVEVSAAGIASLYTDILGVFVLDTVDEALAGQIRAAGVRAVVAQTLMRSLASKRDLAARALEAARG